MTAANVEAITRRIQQAVDIVDLVGEHVRLKRAGRDWRGLCPFHQEKSPSFYVSPAKQIFKCFGCGAGGDVFKFVQLRERIGFKEARAILAARANISLDTETGRTRSDEPDKAAIARANDWAVRWFRKQLGDPAGERARAYAARRGLSPETIDAFELGFAPDSWEALRNAAQQAGVPAKLLQLAGLARPGREGSLYDTFRNRLMFPIRDVMQRVVGFGGRTLADDPAKYLNTPETPLFDKARCLFGLDKAKTVLSPERPAVVVEGYLDCIMAHQFGFPETVATLGTSLGAEHANILRRYTEAVILLFDSDDAGIRAAERALPIFMARRVDVRLTRVPAGKDPADYLLADGAEAFRTLLIKASDALESKWNLLEEQYQGRTSVAGRGRAIEEFLASIAPAIASGSVDSIQRGLVLNQLGKLLGIAVEEIDKRLSALARREAGRDAERPSPDNPAASVAALPDAVTRAFRELLEVLLNEPGYYEQVRSSLDPRLLPDSSLRAVAQRMIEMEQAYGVFDLAQLLAATDSLDEARLIADLAFEGERRGNFEASIDGALRRIEQEQVRRTADELRRIEAAPPSEQPASDRDELAKSRVDMARRHRHFAPRRALRAAFGPAARD